MCFYDEYIIQMEFFIGRLKCKSRIWFKNLYVRKKKKELDYRYIIEILGKFGISEFILGFWVYKIYDIQIQCMLGKKVRQRLKVYFLWILSQVQRKYMELWGEDIGERGVVLGMQLGIVKWGGGWG